jgi:hypothetical protein
VWVTVLHIFAAADDLSLDQTMQSSLWSVVAVTLALSGTALAQGGVPSPFPPGGLLNFQGTPEEQAACSPDATKFCSDAIPDTFRVLPCLQQNRARLHKVCLQVLELHGQ